MGLVGAGVELGEQVAGLDHLAFVEQDLVQGAVDTGADQDGLERLDRADRFLDDRHILCCDGGRGDGNAAGGAGRGLREGNGGTEGEDGPNGVSPASVPCRQPPLRELALGRL